MFETRHDGPVMWLTFRNPGRRNAIPSDQFADLAGLFREFEASESRVLVLIGADGDFCSGADVGSGLMPESVFDGYDMVGRGSDAALALHSLSKPTIAAVDGVAAGAGMNLALGCDLLIATEAARFSEIFVKRGLTVDFGGTWLLPRRVGMGRAMDLALTGRVLDVEEAERIGIVSRRVEGPEHLVEEATAIATELASGAPLAQRFIKSGFTQSFEMSFEDALSFEGTAQAILMRSEDFIEGVTSFLQKRPPDFKGR